MRRKYLLAGQVVFLLLIATTLYFEGHHIARLRQPQPFGGTAGDGLSGVLDDVSTAAPVEDGSSTESTTTPTTSLISTSTSSASLTSSTSSTPTSISTTSSPTDLGTNTTSPNILSAANITLYLDAILDPTSTALPRLECPQIHGSKRYAVLQTATSTRDAAPDTPIDYFFAIDLREAVHLLPRLLGSVVEAIRFLGPARCALSIIEGNSHDGTQEVLAALRPSLDALTTTYYLRSSDIDPQQGDRIAKLAALRNLALQPLQDGADQRYSALTTIVFLNDVAACPEDILELVLQRQTLGADMVCGFDWVYVGRDPTFYDVWVARGMGGDSFFEVPADGNWNAAWNLFWNDDDGRTNFFEHRPFQVFSCWNGAAVFTAAPLVDGTIRFRGPSADECKQGEPQLFCKDMWHHGHGKIAVVPAVNLEYSDENARRIKDLKGYTNRWAGGDKAEDVIHWKAEPPAQVKCMPSYDKQTFRPWDEGL